jgi:hypothetical protein
MRRPRGPESFSAPPVHRTGSREAVAEPTGERDGSQGRETAVEFRPPDPVDRTPDCPPERMHRALRSTEHGEAHPQSMFPPPQLVSATRNSIFASACNEWHT